MAPPGPASRYNGAITGVDIRRASSTQARKYVHELSIGPAPMSFTEENRDLISATSRSYVDGFRDKYQRVADIAVAVVSPPALMRVNASAPISCGESFSPVSGSVALIIVDMISRRLDSAISDLIRSMTQPRSIPAHCARLSSAFFNIHVPRSSHWPDLPARKASGIWMAIAIRLPVEISIGLYCLLSGLVRVSVDLPNTRSVMISRAR